METVINGFLKSNATGMTIVILQLIGSIVMIAVMLGKFKSLSIILPVTKRFKRDFATSPDVIEYYLQRRNSRHTPIENIYNATIERLLKIISPTSRNMLIEHKRPTSALTSREIELVGSFCAQTTEDEKLKLENGTGVIATIVTLAPMMGLLGTVWGVLDAFADLGRAHSADIATLAPSISAALVTTVVGLLIAIPGQMISNRINASIRNLANDLDGFAEELVGRMACEFQGGDI